MAVVVRRFDVWLVSWCSVAASISPLSQPSPIEGEGRGREIQKSRPCLIISPDEMNRHMGTVIIAPMTTRVRDYPTRVPWEFEGRQGQIVLDQIRTVDKARLVRRLGGIDEITQMEVLSVLSEMFAP